MTVIIEDGSAKFRIFPRHPMFVFLKTILTPISMLQGGENISLADLALFSAILFVIMFFSHFIPKWFGMGKAGEKYMLVIFFGLCVGFVFNVILPGSLVVVTEAHEDYEAHNSSEHVEALFHFGGLTHGGGGDEDGDFRRILGVAICTGFMLLFVADFIAKEMTKKKNAQEVVLPSNDDVALIKKNTYSNCGLKFFFSMFYLFAALGCMGGYLACESDRQRLFILIAEAVVVIPTSILYGMQTKRDQTSTKKSRQCEGFVDVCSGE